MWPSNNAAGVYSVQLQSRCCWAGRWQAAGCSQGPALGLRPAVSCGSTAPPTWSLMTCGSDSHRPTPSCRMQAQDSAGARPCGLAAKLAAWPCAPAACAGRARAATVAQGSPWEPPCHARPLRTWPQQQARARRCTAHVPRTPRARVPWARAAAQPPAVRPGGRSRQRTGGRRWAGWARCPWTGARAQRLRPTVDGMHVVRVCICARACARSCRSVRACVQEQLTKAARVQALRTRLAASGPGWLALLLPRQFGCHQERLARRIQRIHSIATCATRAHTHAHTQRVTHMRAHGSALPRAAAGCATRPCSTMWAAGLRAHTGLGRACQWPVTAHTTAPPQRTHPRLQRRRRQVPAARARAQSGQGAGRPRETAAAPAAAPAVSRVRRVQRRRQRCHPAGQRASSSVLALQA